MSKHRKLTLEKEVLPSVQPGLEPATFRSRVRELSALPRQCGKQKEVLLFFFEVPLRVSSGAEGPGLVSVCEPGAKLRAGVAALAGGRKAGLWSRLISPRLSRAGVPTRLRLSPIENDHPLRRRSLPSCLIYNTPPHPLPSCLTHSLRFLWT